eukprot:541844-Prorocentrum_minimum.AAC.1
MDRRAPHRGKGVRARRPGGGSGGGGPHDQRVRSEEVERPRQMDMCGGPLNRNNNIKSKCRSLRPY